MSENVEPLELTKAEPTADMLDVISMPEAPASWNVRYYDAMGFECQLTLRDFTAGALLPRTSKATEWLEAHGCVARMPRGNGNAPASNGGGDAGGDDAPTCKYHGKMKRSQYGGWYCTARMGDGSYCTEKVKDS